MKTRNHLQALTLTVGLGGSLLGWTACSDGSTAIKEPAPDARSIQPGHDGGPVNSIPDAGTLPDGAPKDCFDNATTHFEIINACTNATKVTKNPVLQKLYPDGGLPPPG
jgi:hypothetical protein